MKFSSHLSNWITLRGSILQCSPLGPLCYIVLISDLNLSLPNIKYVDDVTLCNIFCTPDESQLNKVSLQLNDWSSIKVAQISSK